ncbi:MAG TPA: hypothetical protein VGD78_09870, partial [Chthoniobacterales bacterium]
PKPAVRQGSAKAQVEAVLRTLAANDDVAVRDVLTTDDGWVVTLKQAFPASNGLKDAHEAMAGLERALRAAVPEVVRVHVDPEVAAPKASL